MKRFGFGIGLVVLSLACGGGGSKTKPKPTAALGETVTSGDWQITVKSSKSASKTKNGFIEHVARDGTTLRIVAVEAKNIGDRPGIFGGKIRLLDDKGRSFDPTPACMFATPNTIGGLDQFNPGLSRSGAVCFEVATDAKGLEAEVGALFQKVRVPLE